MAKVEQKQLEGLVYRTSKVIKGDDGKKRYIPVERALKLDDLLAESERDATFVVVTKDGRKHVIAKALAKGGKAGKED